MLRAGTIRADLRRTPGEVVAPLTPENTSFALAGTARLLIQFSRRITERAPMASGASAVSAMSRDEFSPDGL
jgi:hypothetical protein